MPPDLLAARDLRARPPPERRFLPLAKTSCGAIGPCPFVAHEKWGGGNHPPPRV